MSAYEGAAIFWTDRVIRSGFVNLYHEAPRQDTFWAGRVFQTREGAETGERTIFEYLQQRPYARVRVIPKVRA